MMYRISELRNDCIEFILCKVKCDKCKRRSVNFVNWSFFIKNMSDTSLSCFSLYCAAIVIVVLCVYLYSDPFHILIWDPRNA